MIAYSFTFHKLPYNDNPGAWGTFGDYLGGLLNPLVSGLTLFVAIQVWQLQRRELEETKEVLREQSKTAQQERSEQRFFDLLNLHHRTLNTISFGDQTGYPALDGFLASRKDLIERFLSHGLSPYVIFKDALGRSFFADDHYIHGSINSIPPTLPDLQAAWSQRHDKTFLFPYFRMVYRLLTDAPDLLGHEECYRYIKLFRAQLSDDELKLIGLNLLLSDAGQNLHAAAEKFGLLKHLPKGPFRDALEKELNKNVFGRKFAKDHPFPFMESPSC